MSDERAIESGQFKQPGQTNLTGASVDYYEPSQLADLAKYGRLYVVTDSPGATVSGQMAAQFALKKVLHLYYSGEIDDPKEHLLKAIQGANAEVFEQNKQFPERRPMATTLTAALVHENKLIVANIGDSRVYVVWEHDIELLNQRMLASTAVEAAAAEAVSKPGTGVPLIPAKIEPAPEKEPQPLPPRQRIPAVLGLDDEVKIELYSRRLFAGDLVVLCSGALTGYVEDKEIAQAVNRHAPPEAARWLTALAHERGNRDPIAVSVLRVLSSPVAIRPPAVMNLPSEPTWPDLENLPESDSASQADRPISATTQRMKPAKVEPQTGKSAGPSLAWWPQKRWQTYAVMAAGLVVSGIVLFLVWRYMISAEPRAAVSLPGQAETLTSEPVSANDRSGIEEERPSGPAVQQTPQPTTAPEQVPAVESTLLVENQSPAATPEGAFVSPVGTPTTLASQSGRQTATDSVVVLTTPSPTPLPIATIILPAGCTNRARFAGDVTVPDGTQFAPGERFEKVWRLLNAETCPWGPGYTVRFVAGDLMGAQPVLPLLEVVSPKTNGEIRIEMTAPNRIGNYRGEWQLFDLNGEPFGPDIYLEIEVVPPDPTDLDQSDLAILHDFIERADEATWSSGEVAYTLLKTDISESLSLPAPQGMVAIGPAKLRGNVESGGDVLLTYPHQELGFIEGIYQVDTALQPDDVLVATLSFAKLSILSDDGVTFEATFTPTAEPERVIFSTVVQYAESPVTEVHALSGLDPGQTGTFKIRVLGRESLSQDWAVWTNLRLVRP